MATGNTNPSYIAGLTARIDARNEAAAMHMEDQRGLRRGTAKVSLFLANALDRIGSWTADALTAGVLGGAFGGVIGAVACSFAVALASFVVGPVVAVGLLGGYAVPIVASLCAVAGFASEYNRIKAANPEKRMAARADWLAAKGGALEGPGFVPPRNRSPRRSGRATNTGNSAQLDDATTGARQDTARAQDRVDLVAPQTPKNDARFSYPPNPPRFATSTSAIEGPSFVEKENMRMAREADAARAADERSQVERLRDRERAAASAPEPSYPSF